MCSYTTSSHWLRDRAWRNRGSKSLFVSYVNKQWACLWWFKQLTDACVGVELILNGKTIWYDNGICFVIMMSSNPKSIKLCSPLWPYDYLKTSDKLAKQEERSFVSSWSDIFCINDVWQHYFAYYMASCWINKYMDITEKSSPLVSQTISLVTRQTLVLLCIYKTIVLFVWTRLIIYSLSSFLSSSSFICVSCRLVVFQMF